MKPVLLAGETFHVTSLAAKGLEVSISSQLSNGATRFISALAEEEIRVIQIGSEHCEAEFPLTIKALNEYSVVVLSDVGALSLLYTSETRAGRRSANRLEILRRWVADGGGLMMAGGYNSFQGMDGSARFHGTPIEDCLPVDIDTGPDGLEAPEGLDPLIDDHAHPVLSGIADPVPFILGMNRVRPKATNEVKQLLRCMDGDIARPLLAVRNFGAGRSLAWMTDIGPHWLSADFMAWGGYRTLMANMVRWLAQDI